MIKRTLSREFQIFAKPAGARCNLGCWYCYYLEKENLLADRAGRMPEPLLETYIRRHIEASTEPVINFAWHGGEPTIVGLDYFRTIVALQRNYQPARQKIFNGLQTNGTLLNDDWCRFFKDEAFTIGISIDGPAELHDLFRVSKSGTPTHALTLRGYKLLQKYNVPTEILCVVHAGNVAYPQKIYRYFKELGGRFISFLPLVEQTAQNDANDPFSVPAEAFGDFLIAIFDEWASQDIGRLKIQIFEEAARTAFEQEHTLCIFKKTCGGVPVVECNGDFYSCDHFVDEQHLVGNIQQQSIAKLLDSAAQRHFGQNKLDSLPQQCRVCEVRDMCNGGCPKNRFIFTPDGEPGLNYLCAGYKKFFTHCRPFVEQLAVAWRRQHQSTMN